MAEPGAHEAYQAAQRAYDLAEIDTTEDEFDAMHGEPVELTQEIGLIRVQTRTATFGLVVGLVDGAPTIIETAPIARWALGQPARAAWDRCRLAGAVTWHARPADPGATPPPG